jgi:signal transduction histidine kinase
MADPRDELKQRLRERRFLLASAFSLVYLGVLAVFHTQHKIDSATLLAACMIVAGLILVVFAVFRLGLNQRFRDPSLTTFQILAAVLTMLFVFYRAPETRLVFAAFFFVALMFGMLRASWTELTILGSISLAAFGLVAGARYLATGDPEVLRLDLLQLLVSAIALPWFVFIGSRVRNLHEADRRKDDFLATLAHELRNPLAPIRTGIEVLRLRGIQADGDTVLPMMERQVQHLTRLLDDLLDVSRITRGKIALHTERTELAHAVQAAVEANRDFLQRMRHEFELSLPTEPVWLDADPVRLAQVFSNLINNAAKYTPPGGRITLKAMQAGDQAEVTVSDNGVGIPVEYRKSIFDMFTQIESHASHADGGLGIGLALVKGLVTLHGGTIEVRSDGAGRGTEFRVRLPARVRQSPANAPGGVERRRTKLSVLVVDDNHDAASSLTLFVEQLGHDVRMAYDGESALRLAEAHRPHTILLDLGMPGIDGYEVCRRIRLFPWGREIRIVAVTGYGQEGHRRKSSMAGFDQHLVKPVSAETLVELLGSPSLGRG